MARKSEVTSNVLNEVRVRLVPGAKLLSDKPLSCPEEVAAALSKEMADLDREYFVVAYFDTKFHPLNYSIISIGQLDNTIVSIPNVFKTAILSNAASMILFHNHPSGNPEPSADDIKITKRIKMGGDLMQVSVLDHIIVGTTNIPDAVPPYFSMRESGLIDFSRGDSERIINDYFKETPKRRTRRR